MSVYCLILNEYTHKEYYYVLYDICSYVGIKHDCCLSTYEHYVIGYLQNKIPANIRKFIFNLHCNKCEIGIKLLDYIHIEELWDHSCLEYLIIRHPYVLHYIYYDYKSKYFIFKGFTLQNNYLYNNAFEEIYSDIQEIISK